MDHHFARLAGELAKRLAQDVLLESIEGREAETFVVEAGGHFVVFIHLSGKPEMHVRCLIGDSREAWSEASDELDYLRWCLALNTQLHPAGMAVCLPEEAPQLALACTREIATCDARTAIRQIQRIVDIASFVERARESGSFHSPDATPFGIDLA